MSIAELRRLLAASPWEPPWEARTFEIDCPCPNGENCGEEHTCEEVAAPTAYPDGQCVVQIDVPGLERFARPTAQLIAAMRNALPELLAAVDERDRLRELIHIHLRENWGLEGLTDDRIPGEVLNDSDRMLYEGAAREPSPQGGGS